MSHVAGKGSIILSKNITLKFILHVPKLSYNLLSISIITKDSTCIAKSLDFHYELQDPNLERMIAHARMVDGLYCFDDDPLKSEQVQAASNSVASFPIESQIMLWH